MDTLSKECKDCLDVLPLSDFPLQGGWHRTVCYRCQAKRQQAYRDANPCVTPYNNMKQRAKRAGMGFNLTREDVHELYTSTTICPVFNEPIERTTTGTKHNFSPSMDRIDNTKGYVKGNVQVLSELANRMKNDATPAQLLMFADWINNTYR